VVVESEAVIPLVILPVIVVVESEAGISLVI